MSGTILGSGDIVFNKNRHKSSLYGPHNLMGEREINNQPNKYTTYH